MDLTRSDFLRGLSFAAATGALSRDVLLSLGSQEQTPADLTLQDLQAAQKIHDLEFTEEELQAILQSVQSSTRNLQELREKTEDWMLAPACAYRFPQTDAAFDHLVEDEITDPVERPDRDMDIAFLTVAQLSNLIRNKKITSLELTQIALSRLRVYGPKLRCVVTLTEERALREAAQADEEIANGQIRGPLHGIPYGIKDLFAAEGYPTQWGAAPFQGQQFDFDAEVVDRLKNAGAVLVAKLSLGALAMGDNWYGGRTESPWNPQIGSSGSSAGSASAVAAGLVPFAVGTETNGSIVSPAHNCRVVGLRPTFGSISRYGAMPLSWSLDKVGPLCRTATDCALVFQALIGADARDASTQFRTFSYPGKANPARLRLGYLVNREEDVENLVETSGKPHLEALVELGAELTPVYLPPAPAALSNILSAECAAAFEAYTRSDKIQQHSSNNWPQIFRAARFVSAVDYIQADRYRNRLTAEYETILWKYDAVIADDRLYPRIYALNCTGHPQILVPLPMLEDDRPQSFSITGPAYSEGTLLSLAQTLLEHFQIPQQRPNMAQWQ